MTTYYLNDPSSNWNLTTNIIQPLANTNLKIQSNGVANLFLKKIDLLNSLKYTEIDIDNTAYILKSNLDLSSCSITCLNDIIKLDTNNFTALSITNSSNEFFFLPTNSNIPATDNQLINKLYVDTPIQQAYYVRGASNVFSSCPKYFAKEFPTMNASFGYHQAGLIYPSRNITVTGLVSYSGGTLSNGSVNQMLLVSFPSLTSNFATVIGKCSNSNFWKATFTTYASNFTEAPFSLTLQKGTKYAIIIYSNSTVSFPLRGLNHNFSFFTNDSSYDLQIGGSYEGTTELNIGSTFTLSFGYAFEIPYVGVF